MTERPLTETLYCTSMRCASSRFVRETVLRKPPQQRTRENAYTRTCARALRPRSSKLLEKACSPLPARSANWLDGLCLASCSMYLNYGTIRDPKHTAAAAVAKRALTGASRRGLHQSDSGRQRPSQDFFSRPPYENSERFTCSVPPPPEAGKLRRPSPRDYLRPPASRPRF